MIMEIAVLPKPILCTKVDVIHVMEIHYFQKSI